MIRQVKHNRYIHLGIGVFCFLFGVAIYVRFEDIIFGGLIFFAFVFVLSIPVENAIDLSSTRFVRRMMTMVGLMLISVMGMNYVVNPLGTYHHHWVEPIVPDNRQEKMDLYDAYPVAPEVVILGSSRSFTMPPSYIEELTGLSAFNASMAGGHPADYLAFAHHMEEQDHFPDMIIVGLSAEELMSLRESDDQVSSIIWTVLPGDIRKQVKNELGRARNLLSIQTTRASIHALNHETAPRGYTFDEDGLGYFSRPGADNIKLIEIWSRLFSQFSRFNEAGLENIHAFLQICADHGTIVIFYMAPYHPEFWTQWVSQPAFVQLRSEVLDRLADLQTQYSFHIYDFTNSEIFEGNTQEFFVDAVHPSQEASRLMLSIMLQDFEQ